MHHLISKVIKTHTFRQSLITTVSTFASAGLGAVFYILVARFLGPSAYGLFSISITLLTLANTVADAGTSQGLVRFVGQNRDQDKYIPFAVIALWTKIILGSACVLIFWLFAYPISQLLQKPQLVGLLPLVGLGIFCYLLYAYSLSILQSLQSFASWGILQIGSNMFRLFLLVVIVLLGFITPNSFMLVFSISALVAFLFSWSWLDKKIITLKPDREKFTQFMHFSKWTAVFTILAAVVSRLDILISGRFLNLSQVGVYSLAGTMVSFLPQLSSAIGAVTGVKFAGFSDKKHAHSYLLKATLFSFFTSLLVAFSMIPAAVLVIVFTGKGYNSSFIPFLILLASLIVFMAGNPLRDYIMYFLHRPRFFVWATLGQGLVLVLSCWLLIPRFGYYGTAISVLFGHIFLGIYCYLYYRLKT